MELHALLAKSNTKSNLTKVVDYVGLNKALFNQLVETYIAGPHRITHRAAIPLTAITLKSPSLLSPHFGRLLAAIGDEKSSNALKRNTIRMFQFIYVPNRFHGRIIDLCFRFLQDKKESIAVKVFSMSVICNLTNNEYGLLNELRIVIEDQLPFSGPAFRSRASKVLQKIRKQQKQ